MKNDKTKKFVFALILIGLCTWLVCSVAFPNRATAYRTESGSPHEIAPGLNLFNSTKEPYAVLVNNSGIEKHRWELDSTNGKGWHHVEPSDDGHLFAIATDTELVKLSWDSKVVWRLQGQFHHDLDILDDGTIFALTRSLREVEINSRVFPILDDQIALINPQGELIQEISLYDILGKFVGKNEYAEAYRYVIQNKKKPKPDTPVDVFHTNSLEVLREDIPGIARAGNILLSVRQLNSIMIVDLEEEESIWYWGQQRIQRQHHASVLKNGNLLLLDNGTFREHSRGIELNPRSEEIVWSYGSRKNQRFFCTFRGGIQRLPNGNTLITNADQDVAFELTPDKRKVWSLTLRAPNSGGDDDGSQQIMYRMRRLPLEHNFVQRLMQLESQT